jgi:hypothetical protein
MQQGRSTRSSTGRTRRRRRASSSAPTSRTLGAYVGDDVTLTTPDGTLSPMGMIPRSRRFQVVGIFRLGLYEFDSTFAFLSLDRPPAC